VALDTDIKSCVGEFYKIWSPDDNFDIDRKSFSVSGVECCAFFIEGFVRNDIISKLFESFMEFEGEFTQQDFAAKCIPFGAVSVSGDKQAITNEFFSGKTVIFVDGFDKAVVVDIRVTPQRTTAEPDKERVLRGSKDGFVENIMTNAALLRRRLCTPALRMERYQVGELASSNVAVCYLENRADPALLATLISKLRSMKVRALTMNQQTLADNLIKTQMLNPFPKFRYTERVDTACAQLLEGDIIVMVDNAPSVMILPVSVFDIMDEANDYYFPPVTGTYLKAVRYMTAVLVMFITPVWLLLLQNPWLVPDGLRFILVDEPHNIPIVIQLILLELVVDGIRLASLNTPSMMTTTFSIIGGIILGDLAVESGWFATESLFYVAFVSVATFSLPSFELSYALKLFRILTLALTAIFNGWGFAASIILMLVAIAGNRTLWGRRYLYPLIPFNGKKLLQKLIRHRSE